MKKTRSQPVSYQVKLIRFLAGVIWFVPFVLCFLLWYIFSGINSSFIILGVIGSFIIGVALFLLVASIEPKAFGIKFHKKLVLIVGIIGGIGGMLVGVSAVMLFIPQVSQHFSEKLVSYYFLIWGELLISVLGYALFRPNIKAFYRKQGLRKEEIHVLQKGMKNYWWYISLDRKCPMGNIRYVNGIFTVGYVITVILHLLGGWWEPILTAVGFMTSILLVLCSTLLMWGGAKSGFAPLSVKKEKKNEVSMSGVLAYVVFVLFLLWGAVVLFVKAM